MIPRSAVLLLASLVLHACGETSLIGDEMRRSLETEVMELRRGSHINLSHHVSTDWDAVYVFGPYTPVSYVEERVGISWDSEFARTLEETDASWLFVIVNDADVVGEFLLDRDVADFSGRTGERFDSTSAVFEVQVRDGRRYLVPALDQAGSATATRSADSTGFASAVELRDRWRAWQSLRVTGVPLI